jgi:hypothetical protein
VDEHSDIDIGGAISMASAAFAIRSGACDPTIPGLIRPIAFLLNSNSENPS